MLNSRYREKNKGLYFTVKTAIIFLLLPYHISYLFNYKKYWFIIFMSSNVIDFVDLVIFSININYYQIYKVFSYLKPVQEIPQKKYERLNW